MSRRTLQAWWSETPAYTARLQRDARIAAMLEEMDRRDAEEAAP